MEELRIVLDDNNLAEKIPEAALQKVICEVDRDGDGRVDYTEFMQMMAQLS